jgi:hypothetical protein
MKQFPILLFTLLACQAFSQIPYPHVHNRAIQFPDIPGYLTLVCDFHQHTVFSDGNVWPSIRVQEALRDSVDAISLTEHLEYQPHLDDIPHPDRNRSFHVAEQAARAFGLIVVNGSEITRKMPPGHVNAIFVQDANKLLIADSIEVFREAKRQGAFTFWNHPNWVAQRKDGVATMTEVHKRLVAEGLLDGIEVVNDNTYSDEALQIALNYNLTIMSTSDIHELIDWQFNVPEGGHRPVTLVFATGRTAEAIKEGLQNRRTVAWHNNTLIGRAEWLLPLIRSSVSVEKTAYQGISSVLDVTLRNDSDVEFILYNKSRYNLHDDAGLVMLHPNTTTKIQVKTLEQLKNLELKFEVLNAVTAPGIHPEITLEVAVE